METLTYQIGSPDGRRQLAVGRADAELVTFRPAGLVDQLRGVALRGSFQEALYALMRPAPWNGGKWRLLEHERDLALADNVRQGATGMKSPAAFDVTVQGRELRLEAVDRDGHEVRLSQGGQARGGLTPRQFDAQSRWYADFAAPADLPVPVVAFLAWLAREGGRDLRRRVR
jgi:hypothetical protein